MPSIVVIDDSTEVRVLVKSRLQLTNRLTVVGDGSNGMEAIALAHLHKPSLLLLDLSMPVMDGLEALPGILEVSPTTRVVVYTGFEERGIAQSAREMGAAGFIEKSLPIERLAEELLAFLPEATRSSAEARSAGPRLSVVGEGSSRTWRNDQDQRLLDEHLESFREVFDEAAIGMATMTLTGSLIRANRALAGLMQCEPEDLVGIDYGRLTSGAGDQLDAALDEIARGIADVVQIDHDVASRPEPRKARCSLAAVRDSKGEALYVFLQVQDITTQAAAEERLRQTEERFRLLVEAVQEYAIFMLDQDGRVVSWNSGAQRIKGYTADEILGQHFRIFYPPAQQASRHPEHELTVALRDGRYEEEGWRVRKDGTQFWASVLITAVFDEEGRHIGFAKVTRNATERRRAEQERAETTSALATANAELESLAQRLREAADDQSRFLAVTAHELRSPLAVLGGSAHTLSQHWEKLSGDERSELLGGMASSARRLERLLGELLAAARLDGKPPSRERTRVSLRTVIEQALSGVRASTESTEISLTVDPDLVVVADQDRLVQAVDNLLRNALLHGAPPIRLAADLDNGMARILVSDAGRGVDPAVQPHLFDEFATGDRQKGTGLGLSIAREIARAHGGDASYEAPSERFPAGVFVLAVPCA